jgi:hypothetical protein
MVGRATGLDPDKAGRKLPEEGQRLPAPDRPVEDDRAVARDAMYLKDILGQIQSDCRNLHWAAPFFADDHRCILAHCDAVGAGAIHPIHAPTSMLRRRWKSCHSLQVRRSCNSDRPRCGPKGHWGIDRLLLNSGPWPMTWSAPLPPVAGCAQIARERSFVVDGSWTARLPAGRFNRWS